MNKTNCNLQYKSFPRNNSTVENSAESVSRLDVLTFITYIQNITKYHDFVLPFHSFANITESHHVQPIYLLPYIPQFVLTFSPHNDP